MKIHWKSSFLVFYAICFAAIVAPAESPSSAYQGAVARPQSNIASKHRAALARGGADILLIQTSDPWEESGDYVGANWYDGVTSDTMVLDTLGKSYHIATWSDIQSGSVDIFSYQVILIVDDQVQQFYDDYALKKSQFEQYVKSGGTLLFFAAGAGWAKGQLNANLPGDVTWEYNYDYNNYIAKVNHPIVTDVLSEHTPLQNADLYSYYCSHGYFASLVAGTSVILVNSDGNPTLIEYRLGKGTVIASTLTWEHDWHEHNGGDQYGTFARKALDDVFLYAFYIAGGYVSAQLNVDIYPEDMWQPKRPTLFKAQGDLIDVVAVVQNNSTNTISGVTLELDIANVLADPSFIKVYRRKSGDHIAIELPTELTSGADYTDQTVAGKRIITISNLTIPVQALMQQHVWNDFVFRFRLRNPLAKGTTIDATATVSASGFTSSAAKLSDGGDIKVLANGRVIVTSREALYTYANPNNVGKVDWNVVAQIQALWQSLYRIAANRAAVIEFVDKEEYVADTDHSITSDIIRYWPYHRQHLSNGVVDTYGNYHYSATSTASDEPIINQVAVKVRQYLDNHIVRSGGIPASGREVLILGGDNIVPFYRKWDMMPST